MNLNHSGNSVSGSFAGGNGSINGTTEGTRLTGTWSLGGTNGTLDFWISADGKTFQGNWDKTFKWCGQRSGESPPSPCGLASWYGSWTTVRGAPAVSSQLNLIQNGKDVFGTYGDGGGTFNGTVNGTVISGNWSQGGSNGNLRFYMQPNGVQYAGNFNADTQWCGFRSGSFQPNPCFRVQFFVIPLPTFVFQITGIFVPIPIVTP
jgi:hypothetical protein